MMRKLATALLLLVITTPVRGEEPDYKALYIKANEAGRLWKEKCEQATAKIATLEQKVRSLKQHASVREKEIQQFTAQMGANAVTSRGGVLTDRYGERMPKTVRMPLPANVWIPLIRCGGPNYLIMLTDVQMTYFMMRLERGVNPKRFEIKGDRTLVHDDGLGCRTYFVNSVLDRPVNGGVFEFEHAAHSHTYPTGNSPTTFSKGLPID